MADVCSLLEDVLKLSSCRVYTDRPSERAVRGLYLPTVRCIGCPRKQEPVIGTAVISLSNGCIYAKFCDEQQ